MTDIFECTVEESYQLEFTFLKEVSLTQILRFSGALQDLVTIGVDAPSTIDDISLLHTDLRIKLNSRSYSYTPIKLHMQYRGTTSEYDKKVILGPQMLFTFEDIGGLEGIVNWFNVSEKFGPVIGVLLGQWYIPKMYVENRFFNAITAAETFHRIRIQEQVVDFLKALKSLAEEAGDTFSSLVGDIDQWAKKVIQTRFRNVVHRGLHENEDPDLYLLSESVYFLVVLCLLQECGVPKDTLTKMQYHQRFRLLKEQIRANP